MLVSLKEIAKYVDISGLTPEEIATRLTFSGIEVEEIKYSAQATNLIIGEVIECKNHPDSDHLHVTKVNIGNDILNIVCGAPNCRKGLKVIVAQAGAKLPGGEIKRGVIRGEESNGMICSLRELGGDSKYLSEDQINGIEELPLDAPIGETNVLGYLGLDDVILDLSLLANRSDCYSLYNVAREIGALFERKLSIPEEKEQGTYKDDIFVSSESDNCRQLSIKVVKGVKIKESPKWLKDVLQSEGIRSIDNIVDIGNYVMLLTGQPIHMSDLDKLTKRELVVKDDFDEEVVALDDKSYKIIPGDLVVTYDNKVGCIAGTMGAKQVEVDENTKNIAIEAANFHHAAIRHTSSRLGLISDSSQRFVKEINPNQYDYVLNLTARLVKELAEGKEVSYTNTYDVLDHTKKVVNCSYSYINRRLGTSFTKETIKKTLTLLHFVIKDKNDDEFVATIPDWRIDIGDGKADLSEEVVRYNGFDTVKSELPVMETTVGGLKFTSLRERAVEEYLLENGFDETLSYTLLNAKDNNLFNYLIKEDGYAVSNPLTEDRKFVRRNLLSSLLRTCEYNLNRKNNNFKIFEISQMQTKNTLEDHLALAFVGNKYVQSKLRPTPFDFYDAKGILESILKMFNIQDGRIKLERILEGGEFHPTRSAKVFLDGKLLAVLGELHPSIKGEFSIGKNTVIAMEVNLSLLFNTKSASNKFQEISKFPSVSRDYAFIVKDEIKYLDIKNQIKKASALIKEINVFDIYKGENIKSGYLSLAINVTIEPKDHTLKEEEINAIDKKIREVITLKLNGEIRQ
ncbi:MAG: phenylalanine--tRNA ligase subunit beta [Bacilli bacterium]|nr:phenylalanine--tRNA ligase subunit beta [Bacilli bacterium]